MTPLGQTSETNMTKPKKSETKTESKKGSQSAAKADAKPVSKNLLLELSKRKAEAQAAGNQKSIFGKDLSSKIASRDGTYFKPTKPGGRNGQGKA